MKKKVLLLFMIFVLVFTMTGCLRKKAPSKLTNDTTKVEFTKEFSDKHVKFKLPEDANSGMFRDLGHLCQISYYTNQVSVAALYPYDDQVEKIDKVTINDFNYETYKYVDNLGSTYIYRTKVNNDYHLFQYYCASQEYDDSQVEKFMDTVEFEYDSITYKQE